jgi:hypothetical protein
MAAETRTPTKNPKTQIIRMMLNHEGPRIILLWVPSHVRIPGNEKADQAVKEAPGKDISTTERYPPDDLKKWLTGENLKNRDQRWKNENNEMKETRPDGGFKTGYTRATHGLKMKGVSNPLCPFCNTYPSVDHIL